MCMNDNPVIFWFRRDLRLQDNHGLFRALKSGRKVLPLFIFDTDILDNINDRADARVSFIYKKLAEINEKLRLEGSSLIVRFGKPAEVFHQLTDEWKIDGVFANRDYEPYGIKRDEEVKSFLEKREIPFRSFKDHLMFEPGEILKADLTPYTVFTPFSVRWKEYLRLNPFTTYSSETLMANFYRFDNQFPELGMIGFKLSSMNVPELRIDKDTLMLYADLRNVPFPGHTTFSGVHLRFGTVSIRQLVSLAMNYSESFMNELIWREFFMHILSHFPHVAERNFNARYDRINWRNDPDSFDKWCQGKTGYPLVDAGMRQLNQTGFMHNRVRMVVAGFLTKHLLIDWRLGEAYFADKLLDYELSSNNGNWQWAAGTGCDAAPYFRVFNPLEQARKFDPEQKYVRYWIPELDNTDYPKPLVDHKNARERAIKTYKEALS